MKRALRLLCWKLRLLVLAACGGLKHGIDPNNVRIGSQHLDPERPMALLSGNTGHGYDLAGAMFAAPYASTPVDLTDRAPTRRFGLSGSLVSRAECESAGGAFLADVSGWMVQISPFEPTLEQQFG